MNEKTFFVEDVPFINFLEVSVSQAANQHMRAKFMGIIDETFALESQSKLRYGETISVWVYGVDEKQKLWLSGVIRDYHINVSGGVYLLSLGMDSHSKISDIHKHTRTFQDATLTYEDVVSILQENSGKEKLEVMISDIAGTDPINHFLVQYEETDWEFLKRLASQFHSYVFPCVNLGRNGNYIGINPHSHMHTLNSTEYTIRKDVNEYRQNLTDSTMDCYESSAVSYLVESDEIYHLRDRIYFNGIECYVYAIESKLNGAQLVHTYTLKREYSFHTKKKTCNHKLTGVALFGSVRGVRKDLVQIAVDHDLEQRAYRWFPYSTVYSSPDNTGWYFMPEIGDQIRLVFPNEHEQDSYVVSSVHSGERDDADTKSIRTRYQKEIVFAPEFISISNGAGSHIELHDKTGITIYSEKQILIESKESIDLKSKRTITVTGDAGVSMKQKENQIVVEDTIDIMSDRLRLR